MRKTRNQKAQNFGANCARAWLWVKTKESAFVRWVSAKGIPAPVAKLVVFLVNISVVAALLYVAFWFVIFAAIALFFLAVLNTSESDKFVTVNPEEKDAMGGKWEYGTQGYGYYVDGYRIDTTEIED